MQALDIVQQLIQIKSITDSQNESQPINLIGEILHKNHIGYQIIGSGSKQNLVAKIGQGEKSVLLNSHFDVVPADEKLSFPKIQNGILYGRGSADAKGPLAAMLCAFIQLSQQQLPGEIIFCAVCDEENAGEQGTKILVDRGILADYIIAGEPTDNEIIIAEKGFLRLDISIQGKELHAAFPNPQENAIILASRIIQKLQEYDFGIAHPLLNKPTISFGLISGGRKINIGAGDCQIGIDVRYLPQQSEIEIIQAIKRLLTPIAKIKISIIDRGKPFDTSPDAKLVHVAQEVNDSSIKGVNFGTDARYYKNSEAIVLGPGKSELAHQKEEYIAINDLEKAVVYYQEIVRRCLAE